MSYANNLTMKQDEMMKLIFGLKERNIEFTIYTFFDGMQVRCGDKWDAVCHKGSYGNEKGLLEIMGLPQCEGDVLGWLTAEEVLAMVDEVNK